MMTVTVQTTGYVIGASLLHKFSYVIWKTYHLHTSEIIRISNFATYNLDPQAN